MKVIDPKSAVILAALVQAGGTWAKVASFGPTPPVRSYTVVPEEVRSLNQDTSSHHSTASPRRLRSRAVPDTEETQGEALNVVKQFINNELPGFKEGETPEYKVEKVLSVRTGVSSVYLTQVYQGKPIFNGNFNANVKAGKVVSYGDSFARHPGSQEDGLFSKSVDQAKHNLFKALAAAERAPGAEGMKFNHTSMRTDLTAAKEGELVYTKNAGGLVQRVIAKEGWLQLGNGSLAPVWSIGLQDGGLAFNCKIAMPKFEVVSMASLSGDASYRVYPITTSGPDDGQRVLLNINPDARASPLGWHNDGTKVYNYTMGNNVDVYYQGFQIKDPVTGRYENDIRYAKANDKGEYSDPFDSENLPEDTETYLMASITNAFYVCNAIHDLLYRYGFDEHADNYQKKNFRWTRYAYDNDRLVVIVQNSDKVVANFVDFGQGSPGYMNLGLNSNLKPKRDASFDNSVILHEYGHGLSKRLTARGAGGHISCNEVINDGLGEGWSDVLSYIVLMKPTHDRTLEMAIGTYIHGGPEGVRTQPYSTSFAKNTKTYQDLATLDESHDIGHVWASIFYEVYWSLPETLPTTDNLIGASGVSDVTKYRNSLMLQLMIDTLKLQPCNANFVTTRDALLQAEQFLTEDEEDDGKKYKCTMWQAFAKRGLGFSAKGDVTGLAQSEINAHDVPPECVDPNTPVTLPPWVGKE